MATNFVVQTVLKLRDDLSGPVTNAFQRIENVGDRVVGRIGAKLRGKLKDAFTNKKGEFSLGKVGGALGRGARFGIGAAAAGITGAAYAFDRLAESMAAVQDSAEDLGLGKGGASFLDAFQSKARQEGVDNATEAVAGGFETFLKRLSQLRDNSGRMFTGLKKAGLDGFIRQLKGARTSTEALEIALSGLAAETNQANKLQLANALFGNSDLVDLAANSEELREVLRTLPAGMQQNFEAAKKWRDAKKQLSEQVRSVAFQLTGALAPSLESAANSATAWITANRELINQRIDAFVRRLVAIDWAGWFQKARDLGGEAVEVLQALGAVVLGIARAVGRTAITISTWLKKLGVDGKALAYVGGALFAAWSAAKFIALVGAIRNVAGQVGSFLSSVRNLPGAASSAGAAMKAAFGAGAVGMVVTLASTVWDLVKSLRSAKKEAALDFDFDEQGKKQEEQLKRVRKEIADINDVTRTRKDDAERKAALMAEESELLKRRATAGFLGEVEQKAATTEQEERLKTGLKSALAGESTADVDALRAEIESRGLDPAFLDDLLKNRQAIVREQERSAKLETAREERRAGPDPSRQSGPTMTKAERDYIDASYRIAEAAGKLSKAGDQMERAANYDRVRTNPSSRRGN